MIKWWNGYGCHVDTTNPEAAKWYNDRHENMTRDYGIDAFKVCVVLEKPEKFIENFGKILSEHHH